jgi:hypothetical protein
VLLIITLVPSLDLGDVSKLAYRLVRLRHYHRHGCYEQGFGVVGAYVPCWILDSMDGRLKQMNESQRGVSSKCEKNNRRKQRRIEAVAQRER